MITPYYCIPMVRQRSIRYMPLPYAALPSPAQHHHRIEYRYRRRSPQCTVTKINPLEPPLTPSPSSLLGRNISRRCARLPVYLCEIHDSLPSQYSANWPHPASASSATGPASKRAHRKGAAHDDTTARITASAVVRLRKRAALAMTLQHYITRPFNTSRNRPDSAQHTGDYLCLVL